MRIGIDFDNTIVSYDSLFHKVALEQGVIPPGVPPTKLGVRDYLRRQGREDVWTEMQGYIYGVRMNEAAAYAGVVEFLSWARNAQLTVAIISHKTRYPFRGPRYDLHAAARRWVDSHLLDSSGPLVQPEQVYFEVSQVEKLARIRAVECDLFIDDLPEVLLGESFPVGTTGLLFDPDGYHVDIGGTRPFRTWADILTYVCSR